MKHYLDLIKISARQNRKQNRMTRLCIVLAVFLVTVIFGMADMEMRSQMIQAVKSYGNWHAAFVLDEEHGTLLKARPEVKSSVRYGVLNYRLEDGYQILGVETAVCGFDPEMMEMFPDVEILEGTLPGNAGEAMLNESAKTRFGVQVGDTVEMTIPQGDTLQYRITGIVKEMALMAEHDAFGMFLNMEGFSALRSEETGAAREEVYYVQFRPYCNIQKAIGDISARFGLKPEEARQNVQVLALMFQSRDSYMMQFYFVAAVLAVLVMIAGILMIAASMNSNIARRTEFFGMMRCLGATGRQVTRFVRREALSWCGTAIPAGVIAGILVVWVLCGMLRFLSPGYFEGLPVFGISFPSMAAGILVGLLTVLLAARAPAKRAAKVSPLTAVSGNAGTVQAAKHAANTRFFKVDTALGIHHASGSRKNFLLVTGSFAFSIILFLSFSTAIDFMRHAITPLRPSAPDIYISKEDYSNQIPSGLDEELVNYPGVKRAFGRSYAELTMPADGRTLDVISYEEQQFQWAEKSMMEGSLEDAMNGKGVLAVFREEYTLQLGSSILVSAGGKERELPVVGVLGDVPFSYGKSGDTEVSAGMVICSEEFFQKLTGESGYAVIDIQLEQNADDAQVQEIRRACEQACGGGFVYSDKRIGNQEVKGASYSMSVFLYGFLGVIALISFFNIINCISMGVSARLREYGAMRAIGMSVRQVIRMVAGEALTYTAFGVLLGCAAGLPLNRMLFMALVTSRWGEAWSIPGWEMLVISVIMAGSVCAAVAGPAAQIRKMTVVDTIGV